MPAYLAEAKGQPRELPPGVWEPPPVRRGPDASTEPVAQPAAPAPAEVPPPPRKKRRAWFLIALLILVPVGVVGGVGWLLYQAVHKTEEVRFAEAMTEYEQGKYGSAASQFRDLAERFPASAHNAEYRFLHDWASLCSGLTDTDTNPAAAADKLEAFVKEHPKDPLMARVGHDAGQLVLRLAKTFVERNGSPADEEPLRIADRIDQVRRTVQGIGPDALTKPESAQIDADLGRVRTAVARWRERQEVLRQLRARAGEAPMDAIKRIRLLLEAKDRVQSGFSQDAEIQAALARLYEAHLASIVYQPRGERRSAPPSERREDDAPSLLFAPLLPATAPGSAPRNDRIVLALARGVLYALKQSNGELKWATRVGVDTTVLPERVPASPASPERLLVLSADAQTLTALDTSGEQLWEYHVGQPVLGRPIVIRQRAYLAAYDGWVHEIELSEGGLIGRYPLGQRLTCGGTREGDSDRIYFPADDSCIYVLDVGEHRAVTILYDGHPSGSLRSEPIIVPPGGQGEPGYLILNQRSGLDAMRLRVFELPLTDRHAAPVTLTPEPRIAGWTWFEPYQDSEKLVVLSDAGVLGLFGIRQPGNRDQALFPLLQPGGLDLSPFLQTGRDQPRERGRSQVVQVRDDDLWVLAYGRLQQVQLRWSNAVGRQAVVGWKTPRVLGSPLHAPQRIEDRTGRFTFFLVTQPLEQQTCRATAVNDEGRILWQRQLGLVCQGEPLALTPPQGGPPLLLALDQGGGLFVLDPSLPPDRLRLSWRPLAAALDDNPHLPPRLLRSPNGHTAYEIAIPGRSKTMVVREIEWVEGERVLHVRQREVGLVAAAGGTSAALAGTAAVVGAHLVVPMADGYLARVPLPVPDDQTQFETGPDWRSTQASPLSFGHVLALGGDRFLTTDGRRGLAVWDWPKQKAYQPLPEGRDVLTLELPHLIAAPPLLLPSKPGLPPQVIVADSAGVLHLLAVTSDGALQPNRQWDLKRQFTGAPFLTVLPDGGVRIGCVLDQRHLAWLDPSRPEPLWTYRAESAAIVGQPQLIEDLLVVAHQSGHYVGLVPATGAAKGPGYTLRASAAPAATPVAFGPDRMFTPLSDGTALLLSLKHLRKAKP
jgi:outer membrane protein assembly factor BamB